MQSYFRTCILHARQIGTLRLAQESKHGGGGGGGDLNFCIRGIPLRGMERTGKNEDELRKAELLVVSELCKAIFCRFAVGVYSVSLALVRFVVGTIFGLSGTGVRSSLALGCRQR